jgi:hypothetical protein
VFCLQRLSDDNKSVTETTSLWLLDVRKATEDMEGLGRDLRDEYMVPVGGADMGLVARQGAAVYKTTRTDSDQPTAKKSTDEEHNWANDDDGLGSLSYRLYSSE